MEFYKLMKVIHRRTDYEDMRFVILDYIEYMKDPSLYLYRRQEEKRKLLNLIRGWYN